MNAIQGCSIEPLNEEACRSLIEWVAGSARPDQASVGFKWLLAHCHDGVTWGRIDDPKQPWLLSSKAFPDLCPELSDSNLLQIRLFGDEKEAMIWRTETGFSGRMAVDKKEADAGSPTRPDDEIRILLGNRLLDGPKEGFTLVGTAGGAQHAVPLQCTAKDFEHGTWPLRLKVRHYFQQDQNTGALRVALSRLIDVFKEVR
ncbi:type III-D CRISPR-associated protein Csx19 [Desulfatiglans anilini]|uniref:type III-D CRISPR-associated protein Csx19 n=1 Tax=Desulfatiglans anilini TaxID=90728 RepID=UPI0004275B4E|nr:CRISPR-associated protein Csx19 [Desulfatiglans anilini]